MANVPVDLTGIKVSSLAARNPQLDDLLYIGQMAFKISGNPYYRSRAITYRNVWSELSSDIAGRYGSMAFENKEDYSPRYHEHSWANRVQGEQLIQPSTDWTTVAKLTIRTYTESEYYSWKADDQQISVVVPLSAYTEGYDIPEPEIGELRFFAWPTMPAIDENSASFDGWTYPDGRSLSRSRFRKAFEYFGTSYGADSDSTFKLPNFRTFFKLNPGVTKAGATGYSSYSNALPSHQHTVSNLTMNAGSGNSVTLKVPIGGSAGDGGYGHVGKGSYKYSITIPMEFSFDTVSISGSQTTTTVPASETETKPSHNRVPAMIYVGVP